MTDSITRLIDGFFNWAGGLAPVHYSFLLRALALYGLPTLFCAMAFVQGNRSVLAQSLCCIAGVLLAASLPLHRITIDNRILRGWFLLLGTGLLAFLPAVLPALVVPTLGMQTKARIGEYIVLGVLFLANLILAWRHS